MDRTLIEAFGRRVRIGMVGGGSDSVIGRTHLIAMRADGLCDLVAGAMSIDPAIARASGRQELLAPDRIYTDWREMLDKAVAPIGATFEDGYRVAEIVDAIRRSAEKDAGEEVKFRTVTP